MYWDSRKINETKEWDSNNRNDCMESNNETEVAEMNQTNAD